jgi:hypothetical protein
MPAIPSPNPSTFDIKQCALILIEIGFCQDFGCVYKFAENTDNFSALIVALET